MSTQAEQDAWIARLKSTVFLAIGLALGLLAYAYFGPKRAAALPVLGQVPAFELTASDGKPFKGDQLLGKVWVASFIFSTCKNSCPMLTMQMGRLSKLLGDDPRTALVSITVDPEKDSPKVLKAYAKGLGADESRWHFLGGPKARIKELVEKHFLLSAEVGEAVPDERGVPDILHSSKLVLVDQEGRIRAFHDGLLGASVPALQSQIKQLLKG